MNRIELESYIRDIYGIEPDYPWIKYPTNEVFRHANGGKWFALVMDLASEKLGAAAPGMVTVVNLKCEPIMIGSLRMEPGIFPAYHMNKDQWISVALDGSVPDEKVRMLLDISYELTRKKVRRPKYSDENS